MRKIISILVAMGLMLSMAVMATPVAALDCSDANDVTLTNPCAGGTSTYCVNITLKKTMTMGVDTFEVAFPEGTVLPDFDTGDIRVDGSAVHEDDIEVVDTAVKFLIPVTISASSGSPAFVVICLDGITNPAGGEDYVLSVTAFIGCCDAFACWEAEYDIKPATSTYKFSVDFGNTYEGIAPDFIPPFKACGQEGYGVNVTDVGWATNFTLTFSPDVEGCAPPCTNATMWFVPEAIPDGEEVWFSFNGAPFALDHDDEGEEFDLPNIDPLAANTTITWELLLHASSPGDYQIDFYVECTTEIACGETTSKLIADSPYELPFKVYQWKEAECIELFAKWNLISLPFRPFNTDIDAMLESFPDAAKIEAIWYFDQGVDDWFGYPDQGLTAIEDGKAYWIYLPYSATVPIGTSYGCWWVWGTDRPYEEAPTPFSYEVFEGWNMVGFTSLTDRPNEDYLFNWKNVVGDFEYGMIYGWDRTAQVWNTQIPGGTNLVVGEGYWIPFIRDGYIYP